MKRFFAILLFAGLAAAQSQAPSAAAQDPGAVKARAMIDKMIEALGGQAYLNIQDMSQEGRTYGFSNNGESGGGTEFWRFYKWPDKDRIELTKQRDWAIVHNGAKGYEITYKGTAIEDPKETTAFLDRQHYSLDHVLRVWLNEPGVLLFDEGAAVADRKPAEKITLINSKNESVSIYIDPMKFLPVQRTYQKRNPVYRDIDTEDETYDNWHLVQGIQTPYTVVRLHNGQMTNQRFLSKVTYNTGVSDALFEPKGPIKDAK